MPRLPPPISLEIVLRLLGHHSGDFNDIDYRPAPPLRGPFSLDTAVNRNVKLESDDEAD